jgi:hypothetical protein
MVGASALVNVAKDAAEGNIHSWGDAFSSFGKGALQGAIGGIGGAIGGAIAGKAIGLLGPLAGSLAGRVLGGALGGGIADAATQFLTTGHVNLSEVGFSAAIGGVTGGFSKGESVSGHGLGDEPVARPTEPGGAGEPAGTPASSGRSSDENAGCNSFAAGTKVLMADGSAKPIGEVQIGDDVTATDPATGKTVAEPVTALHLNRDHDLATVAVDTARTSNATRSLGKTAPAKALVGALSTIAVLATTQHHPFWDETTHQWTYAGNLQPGVSSLLSPDGTTHTVAAAKSYTGTHDMYNLTIADLHTYYVLAGDTPVLVHNTSPIGACGVQGPGTAAPSRRDLIGARPYAVEGVPITAGVRIPQRAQIQIDDIGDFWGCASCGRLDSGLPNRPGGGGNWIGDHAGGSKFVRPGSPVMGYPHCVDCSPSQGGMTSHIPGGNGIPLDP